MRKIIIMLTLLVSASSYADAPIPSVSEPTKVFLSMCSGLDISDLVIAYINCMGRVRGYADGHTMTIRLMQLAAKEQSTPAVLEPLWCIPANVTDRDLLNGVVEWTGTHPVAFKKLATKYPGTTGSLAVITEALRTQYQCHKE